jgi:hypothetical protein
LLEDVLVARPFCRYYGAHQTNVLLASEGHINHLRDETAAADTGNPKVVYLAESGTDWILLTAFMVAQAVTVIYVPIRLPCILRRQVSAPFTVGRRSVRSGQGKALWRLQAPYTETP